MREENGSKEELMCNYLRWFVISDGMKYEEVLWKYIWNNSWNENLFIISHTIKVSEPVAFLFYHQNRTHSDVHWGPKKQYNCLMRQISWLQKIFKSAYLLYSYWHWEKSLLGVKGWCQQMVCMHVYVFKTQNTVCKVRKTPLIKNEHTVTSQLLLPTWWTYSVCSSPSVVGTTAARWAAASATHWTTLVLMIWTHPHTPPPPPRHAKAKEARWGHTVI